MSRRLDSIRLEGWPFDLAATLNSGQVFHWSAAGRGWVGAIGNLPVYLEQPAPDTLRCTRGMRAKVRHYLGLDHDMAAIAATFPADDEPLRRAVAWCPGLRLLRQPKWECLGTFITSSLKQVPHIRKISLTLRERFGKRLAIPGTGDVWTWPAPETIVTAGEAALRDCGLGYRAPYLHRSAAMVASGEIDLEALASLPEPEAAAALCSLPGVGAKVAACALLFGWEMADAFPVDVWVERVLRRLYFPQRPGIRPRDLRDFAHRRFGPFRGYAQQFLFHHARTGGATEA